MTKAKRPKRYVTKALKAKIMAEASREYGRIGGLRRSQNLTPEERKAIATKASKAAAKARRAKALERKRRSQQ